MYVFFYFCNVQIKRSNKKTEVSTIIFIDRQQREKKMKKPRPSRGKLWRNDGFCCLKMFTDVNVGDYCLIFIVMICTVIRLLW